MPVSVQISGEGVRILGALGFGTPVSELRAAERQLAGADANSGTIDVDLAALTAADSATLAVLLAWAAHARRNGDRLRYAGMSVELSALARLADAERLLNAD